VDKATDGNLGKHIEILARHDLVSVGKGYVGRRPRTWISISRAGKKALKQEVNALTALLNLNLQRCPSPMGMGRLPADSPATSPHRSLPVTGNHLLPIPPPTSTSTPTTGHT
jgi:hypothetical protein